MTPSRSSASQPLPRADRRAWLLIAALGCLLGALAAGFFLLRPTRSIRSTFDRLAGAAEQRDRATLQSLVSPDYRDQRGLNRDNLLSQLLQYLDRSGLQRVGTVSFSAKIDPVDSNLASATAKVWLTEAEPTAQGHREALQLDLGLRREHGVWHLLSAEEWPLPSADFTQE